MTEKEKNEAAAAPPKPLTIGGQVYLISPPTVSQNASIFDFIRKRLARRATPLSLLANDPAFKLLPIQAQVEAAREGAKAQVAGAQNLDPVAILDELMAPETLAFTVWLLARGNHPGLRLEDLAPHVTADNASQVFTELNEASGMAGLGETPGPVG
jgi:hypothetical protein